MGDIPERIRGDARKAIYDTGRGMIGRERNYLEDRVCRALLAAEKRGREEAAKIAERDVDWTLFQRRGKKDWKTGEETNVFAPPVEPDDTMPTDANVYAYKMGIAAGRAIAAAIRSGS